MLYAWPVIENKNIDMEQDYTYAIVVCRDKLLPNAVHL